MCGWSYDATSLISGFLMGGASVDTSIRGILISHINTVLTPSIEIHSAHDAYANMHTTIEIYIEH